MAPDGGDHRADVNDIPDNELVGRVVRHLRLVRGSRRPKVPRWSVVADLFALGSTYSAQLCRRYGMDPDEYVSNL
jgi:hypothetical protein